MKALLQHKTKLRNKKISKYGYGLQSRLKNSMFHSKKLFMNEKTKFSKYKKYKKYSSSIYFYYYFLCSDLRFESEMKIKFIVPEILSETPAKKKRCLRDTLALCDEKSGRVDKLLHYACKIRERFCLKT